MLKITIMIINTHIMSGIALREHVRSYQYNQLINSAEQNHIASDKSYEIRLFCSVYSGVTTS